MSRKLVLAMAFLAVGGMVACGGSDPVDPGQDDDPLVGVWFSGGEDVAVGLRGEPFNVDSIRADFRANQTYEVLQYTPQATITLTGTWEAGAGAAGTIRPITVTQTSPVAVIATGIFRIDGNTMDYEVIQAEPALAGVVPPTVSGGFGSTMIAGTAYDIFVQGYVRRN
jgi:hypothetical protein